MNKEDEIKEIKKLKLSYRYFKKNSNLEKFNTKHPNGLKVLKEVGYVGSDLNTATSISNHYRIALDRYCLDVRDEYLP